MCSFSDQALTITAQWNARAADTSEPTQDVTVSHALATEYERNTNE
jgi:hypothetical protein